MTAPVLEMIQQDQLALSIARALAEANKAARTHGIEPEDSLVTITQEASSGGRRWCIHYGIRDCVGRRGGDLSVLVDECSGSVPRIIRGQ